MVEKLTRERRREQTRDVLIAAATEVFAKRGYEGASLEEIAETAGFTRGAIYKNFDGKEDLFFAVTTRFNDLILEAFRAIAPTSSDTKEWDFSKLAEMWRASVDEFDDLFAISLEYQLYVLRNPGARKLAAAQRKKQRALIAAFIEEIADRAEMKLRMPALTLAGLILAAADGLTYAARVDGEELFESFLELLNAGMIED